MEPLNDILDVNSFEPVEPTNHLILDKIRIETDLYELNRFINDPGFNDSVKDPYQRGLMIEQRDAMRQYYSILCTRLALL